MLSQSNRPLEAKEREIKIAPINGGQRYIIEAMLNTHLEDLLDLERTPLLSANKVKAVLQAMISSSGPLSTRQKKKFKKDLSISIDFIRSIQAHPCPQNRASGTFETEVEGLVSFQLDGHACDRLLDKEATRHACSGIGEQKAIFKNGKVISPPQLLTLTFPASMDENQRSTSAWSVTATEPEGKLGLTALDDEKTLITKEAVTSAITTIIENEIAHASAREKIEANGRKLLSAASSAPKLLKKEPILSHYVLGKKLFTIKQLKQLPEAILRRALTGRIIKALDNHLITAKHMLKLPHDKLTLILSDAGLTYLERKWATINQLAKLKSDEKLFLLLCHNGMEARKFNLISLETVRALSTEETHNLLSLFADDERFERNKKIAMSLKKDLLYTLTLDDFALRKISNLLPYIKHFHNKQEPALSLEEVLSLTERQIQNLALTYSFILNKQLTLEQAKQLTQAQYLLLKENLNNPAVAIRRLKTKIEREERQRESKEFYFFRERKHEAPSTMMGEGEQLSAQEKLNILTCQALIDKGELTVAQAKSLTEDERLFYLQNQSLSGAQFLEALAAYRDDHRPETQRPS